MPKRLPMTIVCFHITAALSALLGLVIALAGVPIAMAIRSADLAVGDPIVDTFYNILVWLLPLLGLKFILVAVVTELVVRGLNRRKYWAWVAGIIVSAILILTGWDAFLINTILGGLALWGLLDPETVDVFKTERATVESR